MRPMPVPALTRAVVSLALGLAPSAALAQTAGPPVIAPRVGGAVVVGPAAPPVVVGPAGPVAPARPAGPPVIAPARPGGSTVIVPAQPVRPPGPPIVTPAQPARPPGPTFVTPAQPARPPGAVVITPPPAGFQVRVPPPAPRFEPRPMRPGPAHVWVDGYWNWGSGRYEWVPGYWFQPPQPAVEWVAPHWEMRGGGWAFVPGYWRNAAGVAVVLPPPYVTPATPVYPQPMPVRAIGINAIATGVLRANATYTPQGAYADDYAVNLSAGQTITIITRGGASLEDPGRTLDVYTWVLGNGQTLAVDDDGAGYPNSRIVFTAPWSGQFVIRVSTAQPQRQGHYTVQTYPGARLDQI